MKKVFDQTVRDLKREVNKKVLKVPTVEQKILDATSNEPWGPHGSDLGDIAQATRNYHEYQMIMNVIWKRINDTGKNWRHVYKALTVLEYLVANGSERVIDEIREHAYQLSTLSDFQYIDSSGRDQGSNVRRRSLSLVSLVNDKDRIHEVRQKALESKDKYRGTSSTGGAYKPGGYGDRYDDDRYGNRDDDRNGYGKERDWGSRDDDRYGRSNCRDGGRYGRDPDDRYGRDGYRDDDYRGRGNDDFQYGSRNRRSTDRDTERSYEDDDRYSTRSSGGRGDAFPQDETRPERKLSDPVGAPPSYEEAVKDTQNHIQDEKDGASSAASTQNASSPVAFKVSSPTGSTGQGPDHVVESVPVTAPTDDVVDAFDEFDPRCSAPAAPLATASPEMDFFGSLSVSDSANSLALMPVVSGAKPSEPDISNSGYGMDFVALSTASAVMSEPSENPFGDPPFKATQENFPDQLQSSKPTTSFQPPSMVGGAESFPPPATKMETVPNFDFGDTLGGLTYAPSIPNDQHSTANLASQPLGLPEAQATNDILDALLPPTGPSTVTSSLPPQPAGPTHMQTAQMSFPAQTEMSASLAPQSVQFPSQVPQPMAPSSIQTAPPGLVPQTSSTAAYDPLAALTTAGPIIKTQPSMEKFEPKSTVWADTLSRGLVNLNISGPKINPLADIGIDFESMNRKEKRKEAKSSAAPVTSTITMGKAMGTGSGIGRAGASGLAPPPNAMVSSGIGMGMGGVGPGMGMGVGMGGGSYGGGMNQPMGMGMNMGMGMGMNMGMGMGPGASMRPPMGMPTPGPGMPGAGYNPMMGQGPYTSQQPYGGGYR